MTRPLNGLARVEVASRAELRAWLAANHARAGSVWLVTWKKGRSGYLPYDAVVEEALCFGWVDSRPRALDADRTMLLLSPRRPGSAWSGINKARIERLLAAELLAEPGHLAIERAKADGSWSRIDGASDLAVPDDLAAALSRRPTAEATFAAFPPSARRAILEWIAVARTQATRSRRIGETVDCAERGKRANAWRHKPSPG